MIISHPKVPEIRDDWLRDENEIVDIFLARGVYIGRSAIVDERQIAILCHRFKSDTKQFVWLFPGSGCLQLNHLPR